MIFLDSIYHDQNVDHCYNDVIDLAKPYYEIWDRIDWAEQVYQQDYQWYQYSSFSFHGFLLLAIRPFQQQTPLFLARLLYFFPSNSYTITSAD